MNNTEVNKSLSNKTDLFTKNIAYISRLDEKKDHPLSDYHTSRVHKLCDIYMSAWDVSRFIKSFDSYEGYWAG